MIWIFFEHGVSKIKDVILGKWGVFGAKGGCEVFAIHDTSYENINNNVHEAQEDTRKRGIE